MAKICKLVIKFPQDASIRHDSSLMRSIRLDSSFGKVPYAVMKDSATVLKTTNPAEAPSTKRIAFVVPFEEIAAAIPKTIITCTKKYNQTDVCLVVCSAGGHV